MPLRDHFRPPLADKRSWDELHGGWPMCSLPLSRAPALRCRPHPPRDTIRGTSRVPDQQVRGALRHQARPPGWWPPSKSCTHRTRSPKPPARRRAAFSKQVSITIVNVVATRLFNLR